MTLRMDPKRRDMHPELRPWELPSTFVHLENKGLLVLRSLGSLGWSHPIGQYSLSRMLGFSVENCTWAACG